jgi:outer membrane protein TolC
MSLAQTPAPRTATSDTVTISLGDALRLGLRDGEEVKLAATLVDDARFQVASARSAIYPKVDGRLSYVRTLRTPFSTGSGFSIPDSLQFRPDTLASIEQRIRYLERNAPGAGLSALGSLFSDLPFGQPNTYVVSLGITQTVFDPSVFTGLDIAREFARMTDAQATEQRLDVALNIIQAYYDAVLADRLATIVGESAEQLNSQAKQVTLVRAAGNASDLDVLRVEVDRQNIEPQRIAALNQRDLALLNLKRLINLSISIPVRLSDELSVAAFRPIPDAVVDALAADALRQRASLEARERERAIRQAQVRLARDASLPRLSFTATFGKQALPSGVFPSGSDFRDDWSAGLSVQVPIFSGGKRRADVELARTQLRTTELQLAQLQESIQLDVAQQRGELQRAAALIRARSQTVSQAERVYSLTNLSYEMGLQTNLQLGDARLQLAQARGNEVQALHDYYVALARLLRAAGAPESEVVTRAIPGGGAR